MKKMLSLILALVMLLSVAGMAMAEGETINVGCLQDISGPTSSLGNMVTAGAQWAVDAINAAGGVGGKQINLIVYDTKGDVTEAINAYTRAVSSDAVSAIIGPPVANIALAIAPESENNNVPVLGFAIDTKCQIKPDGTPYKNMFAFQPNAVQQGTIMAKFAVKNGFKNFGVIYNEGNAYSVSLQAPFIETATAAGAPGKNSARGDSPRPQYRISSTFGPRASGVASAVSAALGTASKSRSSVARRGDLPGVKP